MANVNRNKRPAPRKGAGLDYPTDPIIRLPDLEVERRRHLEQARRNDAVRREPRGVGRAGAANHVRVEQVEDVEADIRARVPVAENLAQPQIDLVEPLTVERSGRDQTNRGRSDRRAACRQPAEGRRSRPAGAYLKPYHAAP